MWSIQSKALISKAEADVFLEVSCFFDDPADAGNLISGSSAFCKSTLNIWKVMVHVLLKPGLENFEHYFTSMWVESNCAAVWTVFGIAFLWDWNENWPFPVLWPLLSFPNLYIYIQLNHFAVYLKHCKSTIPQLKDEKRIWVQIFRLKISASGWWVFVWFYLLHYT